MVDPTITKEMLDGRGMIDIYLVNEDMRKLTVFPVDAKAYIKKGLATLDHKISLETSVIPDETPTIQPQSE